MLIVNDSTPAAAAPAIPVAAAESPKLIARDLKFHYGDYLALKDINLQIAEHKVTAIIGPSGCGKSTLLRVFNRIYSIYPKLRAVGEVLLDGENILDSRYSLNRLRSSSDSAFALARIASFSLSS